VEGVFAAIVGFNLISLPDKNNGQRNMGKIYEAFLFLMIILVGSRCRPVVVKCIIPAMVY